MTEFEHRCLTSACTNEYSREATRIAGRDADDKMCDFDCLTAVATTMRSLPVITVSSHQRQHACAALGECIAKGERVARQKNTLAEIFRPPTQSVRF